MEQVTVKLPEIIHVGQVLVNVLVVHFMFEFAAQLLTVSKELISKPRSAKKYRLGFNSLIRFQCIAGLFFMTSLAFCWFLSWWPCQFPVFKGPVLAFLALRFGQVSTRALSCTMKLFADENDRTLLSFNERNFGSGLAHNYWDGLLRHILYKDPEDQYAGESVIDRMRESGIQFSTNKLVVLVPSSTMLVKDSELWLECYNMQLEKDLDLEPVMFVNGLVSQRESCFFPRVAKIFDPEGKRGDITICYDFPQLLRSGLSQKKYNDPPKQREENVRRFVLELKKTLKEYSVCDKAKIVHYDDSKLEKTRNLYELVADEILNDDDELSD